MEFDSSTFSARGGRSFLALCWIGGLGLGAYLGAQSGFPGMHSLAIGPVSIVSLLFITFLPLLITAAAVMVLPWALLPVCLCRAFLFSYVAMGICRTFGDCGWLHLGLAMFGRIALLPPSYYLWLRLLGGSCRRRTWLAMACLAALAAVLDYHIASPLWQKLITLYL